MRFDLSDIKGLKDFETLVNSTSDIRDTMNGATNSMEVNLPKLEIEIVEMS